MTTERIRQIEELFGRALEIPATERSAFLQRECGADDGLRSELESLLEADTDARTFLEQPVVEHGMDLSAATRTAAVPGQRVGHYELLRRIGAGGMSEVYLAVRADDEYQKRVALKVIRQDLDREDMLRRFRTERQILAGLDHPNIATLLDGGTTDEGRPYFVMDFIDGVAIDTYCDDHRLSVRERLELFRTVCSAVQYAHQNLVVHRDIKSTNIMVTADGVPKLLDFGIAKLLKPDQFAQQVEYTSTWMRPMTPRYASPEQIQGRPVTTASDVYSLGVLLYRLLTGHLPYRLDGRPTTELGRLILEQEPERPSTAVTRVESSMPEAPAGASSEPTPEVLSLARGTQPQQLRRLLSGDLDNIVLMAIRKEPQRRYASVEQFSEDIRRYLTGLPVAARADTFSYRATKFVQRNRWGVGAAAAIVALLIGFAVTMTVQATRIAHERDQARRERDRAERITALMQGLFEVSDPTMTRDTDISAREILERGAERVALELDDQPEDRAAMMEIIGNVYRGLGLYERARPLLEEALQTRRDLLGEDDPAVAESLDGLGHLEGLMGEYAASETHLKQALRLRRQWVENDPMSVVETLNQLGVLSGLIGQYEPAEGHYLEALAIHEQYFGETDALADTFNNLGALLLRTGRLPEAEARFREAEGVRRRVLGSEHPALGRILGNLGVALGMQGDFEDSEVALREALRLYREGLPADHPWLIEGLNNLGKLLQRKGEPAAAEPLYREALEVQRKRLGDDHPKLAYLVSNLAELLLDRGEYTAAEQFAREALAIRRRVLGDQHPEVGNSLILIGGVLIESDRADEAEPLLREARAIYVEALPEKHWQHAHVSACLGHSLAQLERYDEAEPLLINGYQGLHELRGPDHRLTRRAVLQLIELYEDWGRTADAERYRALFESP